MTDTEKLILEKLDSLGNEIQTLKSELQKTNQDITNIRLILENDISKKIDIIGEGHDFVKDNMHRALEMETKRERMELDIISNRMEIRKIKDHLGIA